MEHIKKTRDSAVLALDKQRAKRLIMTLGIVVTLVLSCAGIGSLYAFFSDKLRGGADITVAQMGVSVTNVSVKKLTYGLGEDNVIAGGDNIDAGWTKALGVPTSSAVATLSDGYVLPISITVNNTGNVTADIYPSITFRFNPLGGTLNYLQNGFYYIYSAFKGDGSSVTAKDIIYGSAEGQLIENITKANADGTYTVTLPVIKNVKPGVSSKETYMLYFKRGGAGFRRDLTRMGNLFLSVGAKSVLPDSSIDSNWYEEVKEAEFVVAAHIFTGPSIKQADGGLSSDNYQTENNIVTLECSSEDSTSRWFKGYPYEYEVYRTTTDPMVNVKAEWEELNKIIGGRDKEEKATKYEDVGVDFHTSCYYKVKSYDDYGNLIAESWAGSTAYPYGNGTGDTCDGGLVYLPDQGLREWALRSLIKLGGGGWNDWVKQDPGVPVTEKNFEIASNTSSAAATRGYISLNKNDVNKITITDLTGLQCVRYARSLYLGGHDIDDIKGKMPLGLTIYEFSLNGNARLADEQDVIFGEVLPTYANTLRDLYLENIGFETIGGQSYIDECLEKMAGINNSALKKISFANSKLTYDDVKSLALFTNLTNITLTNNPNMMNVAGLFTKTTHKNLMYLNLKGIGATVNDLNVVQNVGTKKLINANVVWENWTGDVKTDSTFMMMTTNFNPGCQVYMNAGSYWGVTDALAAWVNSTLSLASNEADAAPDPEPTESPDPEPTESPDPEPTESPDPEPTESPDPEPTESPDPEPTESPDPEPTEPVTVDDGSG